MTKTCPYCESDRTESKEVRNKGLPNEYRRYTCLNCGKTHSRYTANDEIVKREKKPRKETVEEMQKELDTTGKIGIAVQVKPETVEEVNKLIEETDKNTREITAKRANMLVEEIKPEKKANIANQTLNVKQSTKDRLQTFKKYARETVDDILVRLMDSAEKRKRRTEEEEI